MHFKTRKLYLPLLTDQVAISFSKTIFYKFVSVRNRGHFIILTSVG